MAKVTTVEVMDINQPVMRRFKDQIGQRNVVNAGLRALSKLTDSDVIDLAFEVNRNETRIHYIVNRSNPNKAVVKISEMEHAMSLVRSLRQRLELSEANLLKTMRGLYAVLDEFAANCPYSNLKELASERDEFSPCDDDAADYSGSDTACQEKKELISA